MRHECETEVNHFLIVGDRFSGFTLHESAKSVSQMVKDLRTVITPRSGQMMLRVGHGVSEYDLELLRFEIDRHGLSESVFLDVGVGELAGRRLAHKARESNVLIADLNQDSLSTCSAALRVHNDNEILLDHQTGQHIQGMVAVEASRQMFLAATEKYFLPSGSRESYYFVINSMATKYLSFLFPLPAAIIYKVTSSNTERSESLRFTATIEICQGTTVTSFTEVDFTAFASAKIEAIETRRAAAALQALFADQALSLPLVGAK